MTGKEILVLALICVAGIGAAIIVLRFGENQVKVAELEVQKAEAMVAKPNTAMIQTILLHNRWRQLEGQYNRCLAVANDEEATKACLVSYATGMNNITEKMCDAVIFQNTQRLNVYRDLFPIGESSNDSDGDGLSNTEEWFRGFHPCLADSFGDGLQDGDRGHNGLKIQNPIPSGRKAGMIGLH